jgi:hypothetical protein
LKVYGSLPVLKRRWIAYQVKLDRKGELTDIRKKKLSQLPNLEDYLYALRLPVKLGYWLKNYEIVVAYCKTHPTHERNITAFCRLKKDKAVRIRDWAYQTLKMGDSGEIFKEVLRELPFNFSPEEGFSKIVVHEKKFYVSVVNRVIEDIYPATCCGKRSLIRKDTSKSYKMFKCHVCGKSKTLLSGTPFNGTRLSHTWKKGLLLFELASRDVLKHKDGSIKRDSIPLGVSTLYAQEKKFKELLTTHKAKVKKIIAEESKKWGIKI